MQAHTLHAARKATALQPLDWQILDVEEEEWEQRVSVAGTASPRAAAGRPSIPVLPCAGAAAPRSPVEHHTRTARLLAAVALLVLTGAAVWAKAEQGLAAMNMEVRQTVFVDTLRARHLGALRDLESEVQSVEFLDGTARTEVVVTQTLVSGQVTVNHHTRFYQQTPSGWRQVKPRTEFWGAPMALDAERLHFEYRALDHASVQAIAAEADQLVVQVYTCLGLSLPPAPLIIEVVDEPIAADDMFGITGLPLVSRIRVPSPVLVATTPDRSDADVLAWSLRRALVKTAYEQMLATTAVKSQWAPLAEGLRNWLFLTPLLPLAPYPVETITPDQQQRAGVEPRLHYLMGTYAFQQTYIYRIDNTYTTYTVGRRSMAVPHFLSFVASRYGAERFAPMLRGFSQYDQWHSLAPAVFGCTDEELEADWRAASSHGRS